MLRSKETHTPWATTELWSRNAVQSPAHTHTSREGIVAVCVEVVVVPTKAPDVVRSRVVVTLRLGDVEVLRLEAEERHKLRDGRLPNRPLHA